MVGGIFGAHSWRRWRLGLAMRRGRTWFATLSIVLGTIAAALSGPHGILDGAAWAIGGALFVGLFGETVSRLLVRYRLPSGRRLPVVSTELMALRIRWTLDPTTVTVIPPRGEPLDTQDSRYVLTHLVEWAAGLPDPVLEQARTLAASTPHLGDLLRLLPGDADGAGGEARLDDLPHIYWAALDFALSRETDAPGQIETVEEARQVAEIAEGLDGQAKQ